jgi:tetratricopeptide (TPR) repeat protein
MLFEQSLPLYRQSREGLSVIMTATVVGVLGRIGALHGHEADAVEQLDQSQALLAEAGDGGLAGDERAQHMLTVALVHNFLGQIRLGQGDLDSATQHFREGLNTGRRASDRVSILISLYDLAMSSQAGGELTEAAGFLQEGLSVAAEAGDETSVAYYLESLAAVAGQQDNSQRGRRDATGQGQWLAARLRAACRARRRRSNRPAISPWRCRLRAGMGVGRLYRRQERGGLRTPDGITGRRASAVTP